MGKVFLFPLLGVLFLFGSSQNSLAQKSETKEISEADLTRFQAVFAQWGEPAVAEVQEESIALKTALYVPRLLGRTFKNIAGSKTIVRAGKVLSGTYHLLHFTDDAHWEKAGLAYSDSILNPLGTANDAVSDFVEVGKTPYYAWSQETSRVEACSINLSSVFEELKWHHPINIAKHVGILVDRTWDINHPVTPLGGDANLLWALDRDAMVCEPVPITSNETVSLAMERLSCVSRESEYILRLWKEGEKILHESELNSNQSDLKNYLDKVGGAVKDTAVLGSLYGLFSYNCVGYTEDLLQWAGMGMPDFPNFGVGNEISVLSQKERKQRATLEQLAEERCDVHIVSTRSLIYTLEAGQNLDEVLQEYFSAGQFLEGLSEKVMSSDALLQLVVSSARGNNVKNRNWVAERLQTDGFAQIYMKDGKIKKSFIDSLRWTFTKLNTEQRHWIRVHYPNVFKLYSSLMWDLGVNVN